MVILPIVKFLDTSTVLYNKQGDVFFRKNNTIQDRKVTIKPA